MATKTFRKRVERSLKGASLPTVCLDTPGAVFIASLLAEERVVHVELHEDLGATSRIRIAHTGLDVDDLLSRHLLDGDGSITLSEREQIEPAEVERLLAWLEDIEAQGRPPAPAPLGSRSRPSVFASRVAVA